MATVYLGLGSNLGDRQKNIELALRELVQIGLDITKQSSTLETDPEGGPPQDKFFNLVLKGTTQLRPEELLVQIKEIEKRLGRVKTVVDGPRTIDIDILLYDDLKMSAPQLTIPHPRMLQRNFVMHPLQEIEPNLAKDLLDENHS